MKVLVWPVAMCGCESWTKKEQGSQEQEVKFQDQSFSKFQDIFVGFTRHVFLCSQILIRQEDQYCSHNK